MSQGVPKWDFSNWCNSYFIQPKCSLREACYKLNTVPCLQQKSDPQFDVTCKKGPTPKAGERVLGELPLRSRNLTLEVLKTFYPEVLQEVQITHHNKYNSTVQRGGVWTLMGLLTGTPYHPFVTPGRVQVGTPKIRKFGLQFINIDCIYR